MTTTEAEQVVAEVIRLPLMSGHCHTHSTQPVGQPLTELGQAAHERCVSNGSGNRANPWREFQPCPCPHHYLDADGQPVERFECSECGKEIIAVEHWPKDEDGDDRYAHVDGSGRVLGEECYAPSAPKRESVSGNVEAEPVVRDCTRCGDEFTPVGRERICPECKAGPAAPVVEVDDDLAEFEDEDDFSDLDDL